MAGEPCPNCGKPTAVEYHERHDDAFCGPFKSPDCWNWPDPDTALIHYSVGVRGTRAACGKRSGDVWTSNKSDVNCEDCKTMM